MAHEKILVADDEPYVLNVCRRVLGETYRVKIARSGMEAIQIARQEPFDLLLTDIKMPGIDGLETAREIRKIHPHIMCITMTAFNTMETALKALRLGIDEFVLKPFAPEELTLTIDRTFEKERLRKENVRLKSLLPLFELNKNLLNLTDTGLMFQQIIDLAQQETLADYGLVILPDLIVESKQTRLSANLVQTIKQNKDIFLNALNYHRQQLVIDDKTGNEYRKLKDNLPLKSIILTPIDYQEQMLGLVLLCKIEGHFSADERDFLNLLVGQAGAKYENVQRLNNLQKAYNDLKLQQAQQQELAGNTAHELKTPLAILMGYATVLEEDATGSLKEHLGVITRNAKRLQTLIEAMLGGPIEEEGQLETPELSVSES